MPIKAEPLTAGNRKRRDNKGFGLNQCPPRFASSGQFLRLPPLKNICIQIADGEKRRRAFIRWALNKAEKLLKSDINGDEIAIRRLEFGAETCLTDLEKSETAEISLPYLQNGIHVEFKVTRDDVRKMSW